MYRNELQHWRKDTRGEKGSQDAGGCAITHYLENAIGTADGHRFVSQERNVHFTETSGLSRLLNPIKTRMFTNREVPFSH